MAATTPHEFKRSNRLQSTLMIVGMVLILGLCGYVMSGNLGLALALGIALLLVVSSARMSPVMVLKSYKAVPLTAAQAPGLVQILQTLVQRAELEHLPTLYYVPSKMLNAFAVGRGAGAAIAVTDGLLRRLNAREITAVIAHELSHIRHNDLFVMGLADAFSRVTAMVGQVGQIMLLVAIPSYFMGIDFPWLGAVVLVLAPGANALLQLALSRSREYEADFGAAQLTRDPLGMAQALQKIDSLHGNWFEKILLPGRREPDPALLRTHPKTADRLARLQALMANPSALGVTAQATPQSSPQAAQLILRQTPVRAVLRAPRWHLTGQWY